MTATLSLRDSRTAVFQTITTWVGRIALDPAATYVIPIAVACWVVLSWFDPGTSIGAGDISPLVRASAWAEAGSLWNHQSTGAGGTALIAAPTIDASLVWLAQLFGGDEGTAQRMLMSIAAATCVGGGVHFLRIIVRSRLAIIAGGLITLFNPFVLLHLPNILFPLTIGVIGAFLGELSLIVRGTQNCARRLLAISMPLAYLSTNPPLIVVIAVAIGFGGCLLLISHPLHGQMRAIARCIGRSTGLMLLAHAWWIVPFVLVNGLGPEGSEFGAITQIDDWGWVHEKNSLDRVTTLTAHWGWDHRVFFPWVPQLEGSVWWLARWALPLTALFGLATSLRRGGRARRMGVFGLVTAAGLIVTSQGLHEPFADVNRWIFANVPGWWLFRDPISKFGPLLVLHLALFASLGLEQLLALRLGSRRFVLAGLPAVLILAFPIPLWNGDVIPDARPGAPSAHVEVPDAWFEIGETVSASPLDGKVLMLPLNVHYQAGTDWGYYGVDIAPQFFDRPVYQVFPGGYFLEGTGVQTILARAEQAMVQGDHEMVMNAAASLGVSHIVVRRDLVPGLLNVTYADHERMSVTALELPGARTVANTDVALVVAVGDESAIFQTQATPLVSPALHPDRVAGQTLHTDNVLVRSPEAASGFYWHASDVATAASFVAKDQQFQLTAHHGSDIMVRVSLDDRATLDPLSDLQIDGVIQPGAPLVDLPVAEIPDGQEPHLNVAGQVVAHGDTLEVRVGDSVESRYWSSPAKLTGFSDVGDCFRSDDRTMQEVGISARPNSGGVVLAADAHSACTWLKLAPIDRERQIQVPFHVINGDQARICAWDPIGSICVDAVESVERSGIASLTIPADVGTELFLYADATERPAVVAYGQPTSRTAEVVAQTTIGATSSMLVEIEPGTHSFEVGSQSNQSVLGPFDELGDCNSIDERTFVDAGLYSSGWNDGAIELGASAHAACVIADIASVPGDQLHVSFEYQTVSGSGPRVCLWSDGIDKCASDTVLELADTWVQESYSFVVDPVAVASRLYLYADGHDNGTPTVVRYRNVSVNRRPGGSVSLIPVGSTPDLAEVSAVMNRASDWDVELGGVRNRTLLTMGESFSPGWELRGIPEGWEATPVEVDGWAQGWDIVGSGDANLSVVHSPSERVRNVNLVSFLTLVAVLGWTTITRSGGAVRNAFWPRRESSQLRR